jgi:hypothetical protein
MLFSILVLICVTASFSQVTSLQDSVFVQNDTTRIDSTSTKSDTSSSAGGIESVISYSSNDSIVYTFSTKTMSLYTKAEIKYQQMELKSERIDIDWNTSTLMAQGVID